MRPGTWADAAVHTTTVRAIVDGVVTDVDAVSLTSEMTPDLPVVGGGPVAVTDGTVAWPQQQAVTTHAPQPFLPSVFPLPVGTPLAIEVGDGHGQWFRQVSGRTDSNTGAFTTGTVTSKIIDNVDRLNTPVTHDPLLAIHPPMDGRVDVRGTGLLSTYVSDLCARASGFNATPPATPATRLSAPLMGSMWPEVGTLQQSRAYGLTENTLPGWNVESTWGWSVEGPQATYLPSSPSAAPVVTVNLSQDPPKTTPEVCQVQLRANDTTGVFLHHDQQYDTVRVLQVTEPGGFSAGLGGLPRASARRASLALTRSGAVWTATLTLSDGRTASYTPALSTGWEVDLVVVIGDGRIGGVLVEHAPANPLASLYAAQTARFRLSPTAVIPILNAMPALRGDTTALTLLTQQARAECASVWIDAAGVLQWAARDVLEAAPAVAVKTTALSVDDIAWTSDYSSAYQQVTLTRSTPTISKSVEYRITLGQAQIQNFDKGQVIEQWVQPASGEDWVMADQISSRLNTTSLTQASLLRKNTWHGAICTDDNETTNPSWAVAAQFSVTNDWVSSDTVKYTMTCLDLAAGATYASNQIKDNLSTVFVPKYLAGTGLPIVRGKGLIKWATPPDLMELTGAVRGVANYTHDVGWWVQYSYCQTQLMDWLVAHLSTPRPEITVTIDPDPRLEMGDKITLEDPYRTGLTLDMVLTGIRQSYGSGAPTMTLAGRLTRVVQTWNLPEVANPWVLLLDYWRGHA
jgi:hypothetical protein